MRQATQYMQYNKKNVFYFIGVNHKIKLWGENLFL